MSRSARGSRHPPPTATDHRHPGIVRPHRQGSPQAPSVPENIGRRRAGLKTPGPARLGSRYLVSGWDPGIWYTREIRCIRVGKGLTSLNQTQVLQMKLARRKSGRPGPRRHAEKNITSTIKQIKTSYRLGHTTMNINTDKLLTRITFFQQIRIDSRAVWLSSSSTLTIAQPFLRR